MSMVSRREISNLQCRKVHVVACDLDDSLVATQSHSEQIRQVSDKALLGIGALITDIRAYSEAVVYFGSATGRTFTSIQELAAERQALAEVSQIMDFHIASVGTAIHTRHQEDFSSFRRAAGWPKVTSWDREALLDRLSSYPGLTPQEPAAQEEYKISYLTANRSETIEHTARLRSHLGRAGLQAEVIVSGGHSWRFVDILPVGVNKGSALLQLPRLPESDNSFAIPEDAICRVGAGDSMNDKALLAAADVSIIPANGQPDLLEWASGQPAGSVYIASERFAAGVLEGLQHHLFGDGSTGGSGRV